MREILIDSAFGFNDPMNKLLLTMPLNRHEIGVIELDGTIRAQVVNTEAGKVLCKGCET